MKHETSRVKNRLDVRQLAESPAWRRNGNHVSSEANHSMNFAMKSVFARNVARMLGPVGVLTLMAPWSFSQAEPVAAARNNHCVNRGPDFVAVAGSDNCVRLGSRVRVDLGPRASVSAYSGSTPDGVQPAASRSHVRTDPISSFMDLFHR